MYEEATISPEKSHEADGATWESSMPIPLEQPTSPPRWVNL